MKNLKRHVWLVPAISATTVLASSMWWFMETPGRPAGGADPYPPLDALAASRVAATLDTLHLERDTLIALNPTADQARDLLAAVRQWTTSQQDLLAARQAQVAARLAALRSLEKAERIGPPDPARTEQLVQARADLAAARHAFGEAFVAVRATLATELSQSQGATWAAIPSGWGVALPVRMLSFTNEQRLAYGRAERHHRLRAAAASTPEERAAADVAWQEALHGILTAAHREVLAAYAGYAPAASAVVAEAFDNVLPSAADAG